jgi:hypothetical protein
MNNAYPCFSLTWLLRGKNLFTSVDTKNSVCRCLSDKQNTVAVYGRVVDSLRLVYQHCGLSSWPVDFNKNYLRTFHSSWFLVIFIAYTTHHVNVFLGGTAYSLYPRSLEPCVSDPIRYTCCLHCKPGVICYPYFPSGVLPLAELSFLWQKVSSVLSTARYVFISSASSSPMNSQQIRIIAFPPCCSESLGRRALTPRLGVTHKIMWALPRSYIA